MGKCTYKIGVLASRHVRTTGGGGSNICHFDAYLLIKQPLYSSHNKLRDSAIKGILSISAILSTVGTSATSTTYFLALSAKRLGLHSVSSLWQQ